MGRQSIRDAIEQRETHGVTMPDEIPMTTRERAYTSLIWYSP
jgi:hypothetical protein